MDTVFLLWHNGPTDLENAEMLIGVFRTEAEVNGAIAVLARKPGFVDYPDRFETCPYELGQLHWTEGFVIPED
jgi:hypothetical protein